MDKIVPKVYLSRLNLITLLSKLDRRKAGEVTAAMLIKNDNQHSKFNQSHPSIVVCAIEDEEYYIDRIPGEIYSKDKF